MAKLLESGFCFQKQGKTYQLRVDNADDLKRVPDLDDALWVATSAPTGAFRCDPRFLELLDQDHTGRISTLEVRKGIRWLLSLLVDSSGLTEGADSLPFSAIRGDTPAGLALVDSGQYVLKTLGREEAEAISLQGVREFIADVRAQPMNGDGVIVPASSSVPEVKAFIADVTACTGGCADASGEVGVSVQNVEQFMQAAAALLGWRAQGQIPEGQTVTATMPLGEQTPAVFAVYRAHAEDVDLFFDLCRALSFDSSLGVRTGFAETGEKAFDPTSRDDLNAHLAGIPLARPNVDASLPLDSNAVNPLCRGWIEELVRVVLTPILGAAPEALSPEAWRQVKDTLAPHAAYMGAKQGTCVEALSSETLAAYIAAGADKKIAALVERDKRVAKILAGVQELERLLLYHKYLLRLANNFVNFSELYSAEVRAMFETGSAVIDGRWFTFAVKVDDVPAHATIAQTSNLFVLYLEITGQNADSFQVAIPATSGSRGNLVVGKRGIFFDTDGRQYGARVARIIENPISLTEALIAPFTRLWAFVLGKIEAMSTASEKELQKSTESLLKAPPVGPASQPGGSAGMLMGISVSVAAVGSAFAFITKTLAALRGYQIAMGLAGAVLVVGVPVSLIAVLKLRRQDFSALLEGCGWAINARMRPNHAQRRRFTRRPPYPAGATGVIGTRWGMLGVLVLAAVVAAVLLSRAAARWGAGY